MRNTIARIPFQSFTCLHRQTMATMTRARPSSIRAPSSGSQSRLKEPPPVEEPSKIQLMLPIWNPQYVNEGREHSEVAQIPPEQLRAFPINTLPKPLQTQMNLVSQPALLARNFMIEMLQSMAVDTDPIILDGPARVGKSATLFQLLSHQYSLGWMVVYLPNPSSWINGTAPYVRQQDAKYQQPDLAVGIIRGILRVNAKTLEEYPDIESSLKQASTQPESAHEALEAFLADDSKPETLIAIDQVNSLFATSLYKDVNGEAIPASEFRLASAFRELLRPGVAKKTKNVVVCATDSSNPRIKTELMSHYQQLEDDNNVNKLSFTSVQVPSFSKSETETLLRYFADARLTHNVKYSTALLNKVYATSCGNPGRIVSDMTRFEAVKTW
ncbi:hypothetical protein SmJEL517_g00265 [Synchytrium microbalum]|uniref:Small ribosomal subunit protein mS29 n=1 Tax=Synchytrium microbalum TaxID=1806994 RepID=A0A507CIU0_9FUNG|nr:uncharacterized protein SmJEL517_g00265 [Synchytrium microbalum]TPX38156.1 hypothetical protein SmJEL517_g00265 [Synchytrium microbalum]